MNDRRARLVAVTVLAAAVAVAGWTGASAAQVRAQATYGPVLEDFGPVYFNGEVDFTTPLDRDYRALFDVSAAMGEDDARSTAIESAARFLNMHAQAGVPQERLGAAIVLHGAAARYALSNDAYRQRYEVDNPSLPLIEALRAVGVRVVICGQTAAARGYAKAELATPVELALSAMTAIKVLQDDGYQIVAF
jgi:intracellular sulfur oxidation DsrE/DsrF family protein